MKKYVFTSILLFLFSIVAGFLLGTNLWLIKDHIPKAEAAIVVSLLNICITLFALVAMLVRMHHGNQKADSFSAGPQRSSVQDQILEKRMRLYQELIMKIKKYQKYYFDLLSTPNYSEEKFNEKKSFQKYDELHKWLKQFHDQNKLFLSKDMSDLIYYYLIAANLAPEDDHHLYSAHAVYHQAVQFTAHPRTVKKIHKAHPSWSPDYQEHRAGSVDIWPSHQGAAGEMDPKTIQIGPWPETKPDRSFHPAFHRTFNRIGRIQTAVRSGIFQTAESTQFSFDTIDQ